MNARSLEVTVLDAAFHPHDPMWGDCAGGWVDPAITWYASLLAAGVPVTAVQTQGDDAGQGLLVVPHPDRHAAAVERALARRRPLLTGPPPETHAALLELVRTALGALVRPDLRGVLVLRMDDVGAAQRRYLESWRHDEVTPQGWTRTWAAIGELGRVSLFCCPGWVDEDGTLVPARMRNPAEWEAVDAAVGSGVADLECHGYTHQHPDRAAWVKAPDRWQGEHWFRELAPPGAEEPPVAAQVDILRAWQAACGPGTALVAPGEAWGLNTLAAARSCGFVLFNSWALCRLDVTVPTWMPLVHARYLDAPDGAAFADGVPAIGYFHDRDIALDGPEWVATHLSAWRDAGARRAIAFADLAGVLSAPPRARLVGRDVIVDEPGAMPPLIERA